MIWGLWLLVAAENMIAIGNAGLDKDNVYIKINGIHSRIKELVSLIQDDFNIYADTFNAISTGDNSVFAKKIDYKYWMDKEISYLITIDAPEAKIDFKLYLYDIYNQKELFYKHYSIKDSEYTRRFGHEVADDIYKKITGKDSVFNSKIYYVSDKLSTKDDMIKELYVMDFDGHNKKRLTFFNGLIISPDISYDGKKVVFSLIPATGKKNIDLYLLDLTTGKSSVLSKAPGINSGAAFLPSDEEIALTLSRSGNAEIYIMNIKNKKLRKITNSFAIDVDPSISKDNTMVFLSSRAGKAMVYTMDPTGMEKNVNRISFVGKFNATPRFSNDGKQIAFVSWLDNNFDIFRLSSDAVSLVRLTKNFGNNESPTFSNDDELIAFSSKRLLTKKHESFIYIMTKDGSIVKRLTDVSDGECATPRWSKK